MRTCHISLKSTAHNFNSLDFFERRYGQNHPKFFEGTLNQAMQKAKNDIKLVLNLELESEISCTTLKLCLE